MPPVIRDARSTQPSIDTSRYDLAYAAFLFCGAGAVWFTLTSPPSGREALFPIGMTLLLGALFALGGIVAVLLGIAGAVRLWRHWPLPVLAVLTLGVAYIEMVYADYDESATLVTAARWLYSFCAVGLPLRWFLLERELVSRGASSDADTV